MRTPPCLFAFLMLLSACTTETYDSGDGKYSLMCAEFADAHVVSAGKIDKALTDDNATLVFVPYATASWADRPDSIVRALIYYNKVESATTEALSVVRVPTLRWVDASEIDTIFTDPLTFESAWMSPLHKYLNIGLGIKTAKVDDEDAHQSIAMVCDSITKDDDGQQKIFLRLYHKQNGVPEYYTTKTYISIPIPDSLYKATVQLTVNSYKGEVQKAFEYVER